MKSFSSIGWAVKNGVLGVKVSTLAIISTAAVTSAIVVNEVYKSNKIKKAQVTVVAPAQIILEKSDFQSAYDDLLFSPVISEIIENRTASKALDSKSTILAQTPVLINEARLDAHLGIRENEELPNRIETPILKEAPIVIDKKQQINNSVFGFSQEDLDYFSKYGLERQIVPASFRGNDFEWENYIEEHLKYPQTAVKNQIEGTVVVKFEVDRNGSISNAFISKSISRELDAEALRLVSNFPDWNSKLINDLEVSSIIEMPVKFDLQ